MSHSSQHRQKLKVLSVMSEAVPFAKTGGLGDVGGSLPPALTELGIEVSTVLPLYRCARPLVKDFLVLSEHLPVETPERTYYFRVLSTLGPSGQRILFFDQPELFDRDGIYQKNGHDYSDNGLRFGIFNKAVLEAVRQLPEIDADIFHIHDWQASFIPILRGTTYREDPSIASKPVVLTIHNLGYQGLCDAWILDQLGLPNDLYHPDLLEYHGRINPLKGGILYSDVITTVSRRYAREIEHARWGAGLEGVLRRRRRHLIGILNGIDPEIWNPQADSAISATYSSVDLKGKAACRRDLQRKLGLPEEVGPLLLGFIGRMAEQKGVDLLLDSLDQLIERHVQFVFLGTGDRNLEAKLQEAHRRWPDRVAGVSGYSEDLAHQFAAGCDALVVPSRFEPCGLVQLYSLRYGTVPIVRYTGGLADTVVDATLENINAGRATGFVFKDFSPASLLDGVDRAVALHYTDYWRGIVKLGMQADYSWRTSARRYAMMFRMVLRERAGKAPRDPREQRGIRVASTMGPFLDWGPPLPARYEVDTAQLCVQSHSLLFLYYEISTRTRDELQQRCETGLDLRVVLRDLDAEQLYDSSLGVDFADHWFHVNPARRYQAELQLCNPSEGDVVWRLASNVVFTPADRPSPRVHRAWMPVEIPYGMAPPIGLLGPGGEVTGLDIPVPSGGPPSETVDWPEPDQRVPRHLRLAGITGPRTRWFSRPLGAIRSNLSAGDEHLGERAILHTESTGSLTYQTLEWERFGDRRSAADSLGGRPVRGADSLGGRPREGGHEPGGDA